MGEGDYHLSYTKSVEDKLAAERLRVEEYKREVERRDELLAGADADLKAERAKTAALRALLGDVRTYLAADAESGSSDPDTYALLERIRKELGK